MYRVFVRVLVLVVLVGCSSPSDHADAARPDAAIEPGPSDGGSGDARIADAFVAPDALAPPDAFAPSDAGPSCLEAGYAAGERYPAGDHCNFCECMEDGSALCTERVCPEVIARCTYGDVEHEVGEPFPAADGCNTCVCAYNGLACTRRDECDPSFDEGAILLESMDEPCSVEGFTRASALQGIPFTSFELPFLYGRDRDPRAYPETLPDTTIRFRFADEDGVAVCLPHATNPIIDLEVTAEWVTADGAFDEGFRTIVRRFGNTMFVDAWYVDATAPPDRLNGSYVSSCPDRRDFAFTTRIDRDGSVMGQIMKTCEADIALPVGELSRPAD